MSAWPQYTLGILLLLGVGINIGKHGTPRTGKVDAVSSIVAASLTAWLLYMGGFWSALL